MVGWRVTRCLLATGAALSVLAPAGAAGQSGGEAPAGAVPRRAALTFVGPGDEPREVTLRRDGNRRQGRLTVVLRNHSSVSGEVRVRYFPDRQDPVRLIGPGRSRKGIAIVEHPKGGVVRLAAGRALGIRILFDVGVNDEPSAIDGELVADLMRSGKHRAPGSAVMRVHGTHGEISFATRSVTLDVTKAAWLIFGTSGKGADVTLRGEGARNLARDPSVRLGRVVLHSSSGGMAVLRISDVRDDHGAIRARLIAERVTEAGQYRGSVPVVDGAEGTTVSVSVKAGYSLGLAVLFVFIGGVLGGFMVRREDARRKRQVLELQLDSALEAVDHETRDGQAPLSYAISRYLEPREDGNRPFPTTRGAASVRWDVRHAVTPEDFEDAEKRVTPLRARIGRWLSVERAARELKQLLDSVIDHRDRGRRFDRCQAHADARTLLQRARTDLEDAETAGQGEEVAENLIRRLARQAELLNRLRTIWELQRRLDARPRKEWRRNEIEVIRRYELKKLEDGAGSEEARDRDPEARVKSNRELHDAVTELTKLVERAQLWDSPSDTRHELQQRIETRNRRAEQLAALGNDPDTAIEMAPGGNRLRQRLHALRRRDYGWTLGRALVAATAYTLAFYSDSWGTVRDFATAFTAGFLTEAIFNWAVLPAFQSLSGRGEADQKSLAAGFAEQLELALSANGTPLPSPAAKSRSRESEEQATETRDPS